MPTVPTTNNILSIETMFIMQSGKSSMDYIVSFSIKPPVIESSIQVGSHLYKLRTREEKIGDMYVLVDRDISNYKIKN